ncbi:hypothetical protein SAMN05444159_2312 [Bradyrhizobium lablabi]|uniref:Uncharacterized protein n=1 Tax=Bradyrhizobium lablabi TaxID=722472 RepID=A0A1M6PDU9_9BRAD|nr:hypothetical protein SAMN05444159_2312 [Bradyrhizobium lablabi]
MQPMEPVVLVKLVMPGLVPGIHVLQVENKKDVDGRDKPGHDVVRKCLDGLAAFPVRLSG